jgi:hypothetical protein
MSDWFPPCLKINRTLNKTSHVIYDLHSWSWCLKHNTYTIFKLTKHSLNMEFSLFKECIPKTLSWIITTTINRAPWLDDSADTGNPKTTIGIQRLRYSNIKFSFLSHNELKQPNDRITELFVLLTTQLTV